jgi:hypothetical protein
MINMFESGLDFDTKFMSDEEVEQHLDEVILSLGTGIVQEESNPSIINLARMKEILVAYKTLSYICKGTGVKVTYKLHNKFQSVGTVSIVGKTILFTKNEWFVKACRLASNIEIYPKTNGTVQINLTFYGLTKSIK